MAIITFLAFIFCKKISCLKQKCLPQKVFDEKSVQNKVPWLSAFTTCSSYKQNVDFRTMFIYNSVMFVSQHVTWLCFYLTRFMLSYLLLLTLYSFHQRRFPTNIIKPVPRCWRFRYLSCPSIIKTKPNNGKGNKNVTTHRVVIKEPSFHVTCLFFVS